MSNITLPIVCRASAEFRRCGWYVIAGASVVMIVMVELAIWKFVPRQLLESAMVGGAMVLASIGLVVMIQSWRLRIDTFGLARRRLWVWDYWPWDEFRQGKVVLRGSRLFAREHRWWCRELSLELVESTDRELIWKLCKHHQPPVAASTLSEVVPQSITVSYGWRTVSFGANGMRTTKDPFAVETPWTDAGELRIFLMEHDLPEARKLEIALKDRTEVLIGIHTVETPEKSERIQSRSSVPSVVVEYLRSHVPEAAVRLYAVRGEPQSQEEYDYWMAEMTRQLKFVTRLQWILPPLLFALSAALFCQKLLAGWQQPGLMLNLGWLILWTVILVAFNLLQPILYWTFLQARRQDVLKRIELLQRWPARRSSP